MRLSVLVPPRRRDKKATVDAAESVASVPANATEPLPGEGKLPGKLILSLIAIVVLIFVALTVSFFKSGVDINWKRELAAVDLTFKSGDAAGAVKGLLAFGERWPDAKKTYGWNEKLGRYAVAAGDWETAAKYNGEAARISPKEPGINARAGEAYYKAGDMITAATFLGTELKDISRASGDHDRANFYVGKLYYSENRLKDALQHFQSIANRDIWKSELDPIYAEIEKKYVQPARDEASKLPREVIP